jgi:hypothetical protein
MAVYPRFSARCPGVAPKIPPSVRFRFNNSMERVWQVSSNVGSSSRSLERFVMQVGIF